MASKQQIPEKFTGATVTTIRRASARLLLALPEVLLAGGAIGLQLWASRFHVKIDAVWVVLCSVAFGVWLLVNGVVLLFQSRTIPALMLGFEYRSVATGQRAGGKAFLGRLLTALLFYVTLGVMGILLAATYRNGQSLVDRWLGLVAIHPKRIRDVFDPAALVPPAPPARVQQVTMPGMTSSPPLYSPPAAPPGPQQPGPPPAAFAAAPFAPPQAAPAGQPGVLRSLPDFPTPQAAPATPSPIPSPQAPNTAPPVPPVDETELDANLAAPTGTTIRLDDGTPLLLETAVVLGRNPITPDGFPTARLVDLPDPSMQMSKTHVVVIPEEGRVKVMDVGARNGIVLELNGTKVRIPPQQVIDIPDQATVHFGGRSFQVVS